MKGTYLEPFFVKLINSLKPLNILVKKLHRRCWAGFKLHFYVRQYKKMFITAPNTHEPAFKHNCFRKIFHHGC